MRPEVSTYTDERGEPVYAATQPFGHLAMIGNQERETPSWVMVVRLAPSETGGRGQGLGFTAPAQPKSSERTSQEDLMEPSEQVSRSDGTISEFRKGTPKMRHSPVCYRLQAPRKNLI